MTSHGRSLFFFGFVSRLEREHCATLALRCQALLRFVITLNRFHGGRLAARRGRNPRLKLTDVCAAGLLGPRYSRSATALVISAVSPPSSFRFSEPPMNTISSMAASTAVVVS